MKKLSFLTIALLLCGFSGAYALPFPLFTGGSELYPPTQFEDNNLDYWEDLDGDGRISVGDVLHSAVEFENVLDLVGGSPAYALDQAADDLVAYATIQVASMGTVWTFQQYGAIPMIQVYTGGAINLDLFTAGSDPTLAQAVAAITDGTHLWDFSLTSDTDTYWFFIPSANNADNPNVVANLASTSKVGSLNYALNQVWGDDIFADVVADFADLSLGGDGLVDLIGSGDILGGRGLVNGAFARSDIDVALRPIPEPATLTLLGFGLLSIGALTRKRKS